MNRKQACQVSDAMYKDQTVQTLFNFWMAEQGDAEEVNWVDFLLEVAEELAGAAGRRRTVAQNATSA